MEEWRKRLLAAIDADPRSDRAISMAVNAKHLNMGVNSVNELRNTAKKPSVEKVLAIAKEVNLSISHLFLNLDITAEEEEFLQLIADASPDVRRGVLSILRGGKKNEAAE